MASIRKEVVVALAPETVWAAVRDLAAYARLAPGVVAEAHMEDDERVVTYDTGVVLREWVVDIDDAARRLVTTATGGRIAHQNMSMQVFAEGADKSRLVCVCDFLPNLLTETIGGLVNRGMDAIKATLEKGWPPA